MADHANSTPAPTAHGPVTAAIRAVALEHDPSHTTVVSLAAVRARRMPSFTPLDFSFPLSDSLWSAVYLRTVRFSVEFTNLSGREAVKRAAQARAVAPGDYVTHALGELALAVDHFEELTELCRIARGRLIEADACAKQAEGGRGRQ
ncbi:hypothetical protein [Methylobacterium sp. 1973]|uniref:hypothetical protein n=1 Tax=Methylobacterium sp. 1973 TaxID=3156421 RepID=UPI0033912543